VDEGNLDTEVCVQDIVLEGNVLPKFCTARQRGVVDPPSAWMEVEGTLTIEHGWAVFRPAKDPGIAKEKR
jgi:hypothetical protein